MAKTKDPSEVLDYSVDWDRVTDGAAAGTGRLADGETISASTWAIEEKPDDAAPLEEATPPPSVASGKTTIWLQGGTRPWRYEVTNHITTSQGRQFEKSIDIDIREK